MITWLDMHNCMLNRTFILVLLVRIELTTYSLPRNCATTTLQQLYLPGLDESSIQSGMSCGTKVASAQTERVDRNIDGINTVSSFFLTKIAGTLNNTDRFFIFVSSFNLYPYIIPILLNCQQVCADNRRFLRMF